MAHKLGLSVKMNWIKLRMVLRPRQHSIGCMGDGFYRSEDPTNSIKSTKGKKLQRKTQKKAKKKYRRVHNKKTHTQSTASPPVYPNMGWLEDSSDSGQDRQAWTVVGLPPRPFICENEDMKTRPQNAADMRNLVLAKSECNYHIWNE